MNRRILALALPAIVANITTPLLSLVDVAIVGHLGSAAYIGAIAVGGSMFSMLYWAFGFIRFGTSGITAQAVGRNDRNDQWLTLQRSLLLSVIFALALIVLRQPLGHAVLRFMDPEAESAAMAWRYFSILIFGAPAAIGSYALTGWFVGMQSTRWPMWISLVVNVTNIGMSLLLVLGCGMTIEGVAIGTLTAQWVGALMGVVICRRKFGVRLMPWRQIADARQLRRFFRVNLDILLRTLCLIAVTVWFTRAGARQSTMMLAVNTLLMQLFILFSYLMDGFAFAAEALCGKYEGANDYPTLHRVICLILRWGAGLALLFTVIYVAGGEAFLHLLTDDDGVIRAAADYRPWAMAIPLAGFMAFTWDGILVGVTRTRIMLAGMALATVTFFGLYLWFFPRWGNHALWGAFIAYLLVRGVAQSVIYRCSQSTR